MLVLDASATVELLLSTELGRVVAGSIADENETLHAPELLGPEVVRSGVDACHVALAEALRSSLLTTDAELAGAHGHRADVRLVARS